MQNKKLVILIVLAVIAIFSLIRGIVTPSKFRRQSSSDAPAVGTQAQAPAVVSKPLILTERTAKKSKYTSWDRNPFSLKPTSDKSATTLSLEGILWDENNSRAVINGRIVGVGDKVGGSIVVDIKQDKVVVNNGFQNFELRVGK